MRRIVQPEGWAKPRGYSNGVEATGRHLFIGGQIGWDADQRFQSDDFVDQVRQALANVMAVLEAAGGSGEHITRLNWYITDKREYAARQAEIGEAYRETIGRHFPAMTLLVVADLLEDRALVEIEATAVLPE